MESGLAMDTGRVRSLTPPHHTPDGPANSKKCRELFSLLFTADNPTFPEYPYLAFNG